MKFNRNYSGIIIENSKGEFLFQLRDNKPSLPYANRWSLFGGGIEFNETSVQAILREVKEELDLDLKSKNVSLLFKKESEKEKRYIFYHKLEKNTTNFKLGEGQRFEFIRLRNILFKKMLFYL